MSDHFEMLVDVDVTLAEAEGLAQAVLDSFRKLGLITGEATPDCVLGGAGYRPGPAVADLYKCGKREPRFWELATSGVEPSVGRSFNELALGPSCEGFVCPACAACVEPFDEPFADAIGAAISEWNDESGPGLVLCPECKQERPVIEWKCNPPFGFGNLSFRFWNWPSLDSRSWKVNIAGIVHEVTGHTVVRTYGQF